MPRLNDSAPTTQDFIKALTAHHTEGTPAVGTTVLMSDIDPTTGKPRVGYTMTLVNPRNRKTKATHLCVGTLGDAKNENDRPFRSPSNIMQVPFLAIDDANTKGKVLPFDKTAVVVTSPSKDNETHYFKFDPPATPEQYEVITHSLIAGGYGGDGNCWQRERLARLPNTQPLDKTETSELKYLDPTVSYDPATFLKIVGVAEIAYDRIVNSAEHSVPFPVGVEGDGDVVLEWLQENGYIYGPSASEDVYYVKCPWHDTHTDQVRIDGAKYFACVSSMNRGYNCFHGHNHNTYDFLTWVAEQGGPQVERNWTPYDRTDGPIERDINDLGLEPIRGLQEAQDASQDEDTQFWAYVAEAVDRYVWYEPKGQIIDLKGEPDFKLKLFSGVKQRWRRHDRVITGPQGGRPRRVNVMEVWKDEHHKISEILPHVDPRSAPGWNGRFVNTYRPFTPDGTIGEPTEFLDLVAHVAPENTEYVLDWLAYKVQHPWERMVALISVSPVFGTGRNSLFHVARLVIGENNSAAMTASRLFGTEANKFNSHMSNLLITVGEIEEGADPDRQVTRKVYNALKEMVDPNERFLTLERKGIDGQTVEIFTSFLLATNAGNGLPLEKGDRRFSVTAGNTQPLRQNPNFQAIEAWLHQVRDQRDQSLISQVHNYLMARDVAGFNPNVPLQNAAKEKLIQESKNIIDHAIEDVLGDCWAYSVSGLVDLLMAHPDIMGITNKKDIQRQVKGWSGGASVSPPCWADDKVKIDGVGHRVRVFNDRASEDQERVREEFRVFLKLVDGQLVGGADVIQFGKRPDDAG